LAPCKRGVPSSLSSRLLAAADWALIAIALAGVAALASAIPLWELKLGAASRIFSILLSLKLGLWLVSAYSPGAGLRHAERALGGLALGAIGGLAAAACLAPDPRAAAALAVLLPPTAAAMALLHGAVALLLGRAARAGAHAETVVIVGATRAARRLIAHTRQSGRFRIAAIVDDRVRRAPARMEGVPVAGAVSDLLAWPRLPEIDRIIVALDAGGESRARSLAERLSALPNRVDLHFELERFGPQDRRADGAAPAACVSGLYPRPGFSVAKRGLDLILGGVLTLLFLPLMALIALAVRLDSRGPALFRQQRHGLNNRVITVWKFRTMRHDPKPDASRLKQTTANDARVTRVGRFLRSTSLDELPQLLNVLKGDMSLVGPRPHAVNMRAGGTALDRIAFDYAHRHRMRPGLTGWAQVSGSRGPIETPDAVRERVRLDLEYIALDLARPLDPRAHASGLVGRPHMHTLKSSGATRTARGRAPFSAFDYPRSNKLGDRIGRSLVRASFARPVFVELERAILSVCFDGFPRSAAETGAAALERVYARGTFYACAGLLGARRPSGPFFEAEDLERLEAGGHEIGCHTYSHLDCARSPAEEVIAECGRNAVELALAGCNRPVKSIAYPFGETSVKLKQRLPLHFTSGRGAAPGLNAGKTDLAQLKAYPLHGWDSLEPLLAALEKAQRTRAWMIVYMQDVALEPSPWGAPTGALGGLLRRACDLKMDITPIGEAADIVLADQD
jgi:exopolysaccharide biosynthesis polyprenyl glycosylphosphotransferase